MAGAAVEGDSATRSWLYCRKARHEDGGTAARAARAFDPGGTGASVWDFVPSWPPT
jgi:hypothetical protein